jgi:hypothetical protein
MNEELLKLIEREVLGWAGPFKKWDEDGLVGVTVYELGCKQIGHLHDGHADFWFPKEVRDDLIRSGQAISHPAFPNSRTTASYRIRSAEDLPGDLELLHMSYERTAARDER